MTTSVVPLSIYLAEEIELFCILNANGRCPVIFCVLTDDNLKQSIARSGGELGNKGTEAAIAAIKMAII